MSLYCTSTIEKDQKRVQSVCVTTQISVILKAKDMKLGMKVPLYYAQLNYISNIRCHAHLLQ